MRSIALFIAFATLFLCGLIAIHRRAPTLATAFCRVGDGPWMDCEKATFKYGDTVIVWQKVPLESKDSFSCDPWHPTCWRMSDPIITKGNGER